jgi:hypothetical protein
MGDGSPIFSDFSSLKTLILKALNKNQILLLNEIEKNSTRTATGLVGKLSENAKIPLSTLKLNARLLKELGLLNYSNPVKLTDTGKFVLEIIRC